MNPYRDPSRLTIPDIEERFRAYRLDHPEWGALHIVLADGNVSNEHVAYCIADAQARGDREGFELAVLLRRMTRTQRLKLGALIP